MFIRRPVVARRCHGDLVDRITVVRGRDGGNIDPGIHVANGRVHVRVRLAAGLRCRMDRRLLYAGHYGRSDLDRHRRADVLGTGIALLSDDGR